MTRRKLSTRTIRSDSPFQFRKVDGRWQRRASGERRWQTLEVIQAAPADTAHRRTASSRETAPTKARNEWRWT
jgi:hypothetical protein